MNYNTKYVVRLTVEERDELQGVVRAARWRRRGGCGPRCCSRRTPVRRVQARRTSRSPKRSTCQDDRASRAESVCRRRLASGD